MLFWHYVPPTPEMKSLFEHVSDNLFTESFVQTLLVALTVLQRKLAFSSNPFHKDPEFKPTFSQHHLQNPASTPLHPFTFPKQHSALPAIIRIPRGPPNSNPPPRAQAPPSRNAYIQPHQTVPLLESRRFQSRPSTKLALCRCTTQGHHRVRVYASSSARITHLLCAPNRRWPVIKT